MNALNDLPESNRFMRGLRAWVGFRQTGVPLRPAGAHVRPHDELVRCATSAGRDKAIFSFSYAPLELITVAAIVTVIAAALAAIATVAIRLIQPYRTPSGLTTVILLVLFLGGVQLVSLSIIGSYLAHIYDEVKRRPAFIVESILNAPARQENPASLSPPARRNGTSSRETSQPATNPTSSAGAP